MDYTIDGKCPESCGRCCTSILPLSDYEIKKINKYLKHHPVEPYNPKRLITFSILIIRMFVLFWMKIRDVKFIFKGQKYVNGLCVTLLLLTTILIMVTSILLIC